MERIDLALHLVMVVKTQEQAKVLLQVTRQVVVQSHKGLQNNPGHGSALAEQSNGDINTVGGGQASTSQKGNRGH